MGFNGGGGNSAERAAESVGATEQRGDIAGLLAVQNVLLERIVRALEFALEIDLEEG